MCTSVHRPLGISTKTGVSFETVSRQGRRIINNGKCNGKLTISYNHLPSPTPSMSQRGIFNKTHPSLFFNTLKSKTGLMVARAVALRTNTVN